MTPEFRNIVQNMLTSYIRPRTRTDGGFAGDTPPPSVAVFTSRLRESAASFKFNSWDLDSVDAETLINLAITIYSSATNDWLSKPLAGDAPSEVIAWHKGAQG
jgi:hypothetical protein